MTICEIIVRAADSTAFGATGVVGLGAAGVVSLTLGGPSGVPHLLVAGGGLTGKSAVTSMLLYSLAARHPATELQLDLIDSIKDGDFLDLTAGSLPQLSTVAATGDPSEAGAALSRYADEAQRRQAVFISAGVSSIEQYRTMGEMMPRWVLVWNEYPEVLTEITASQVEWLARHGAQAGLHLVLTALTPFEGLRGAGVGLPDFAERSGRLLTRLGEEDSLELLGSLAAVGLLRRKQALFATAVDGTGIVLSIPEIGDEDLATLRASLGGFA